MQIVLNNKTFPKELNIIIFEYFREYNFLDEYKKLLTNEPASKLTSDIFYTRVPRICNMLFFNDYYDMMLYNKKIFRNGRLYKPNSMQMHKTPLRLDMYGKCVYTIIKLKWYNGQIMLDIA